MGASRDTAGGEVAPAGASGLIARRIDRVPGPPAASDLGNDLARGPQFPLTGGLLCSPLSNHLRRIPCMTARWDDRRVLPNRSESSLASMPRRMGDSADRERVPGVQYHSNATRRGSSDGPSETDRTCEFE